MARGNRGPERYVGIVNVDKPRGMTSHDVVNRVRRATGMRRVGHAGTLDPEATGVLLVCLGQATRLSDYLMGGTKRYHAVVRFGATSTTDDAAGVITPIDRPIDLSMDELRLALDRFVGEIEQVPPTYAAIKVEGRPLYQSARAGVAVEVPPRRVRIDAIELLAWDGRDLTIEVTSSKGTYIRALARDLGEAVGSGAYLLSLVRLASGRFVLDTAVGLDDVAIAAQGGFLERVLYPLDAALSGYPAFWLSPAEVTRTIRGQSLPRPSEPDQPIARGYDSATGRLVGVFAYDAAARAWHANPVFPEEPVDDSA